MTEPDLDELLEGARKANPPTADPWWSEKALYDGTFFGRIDARHTANCDPPTIIAIIERLQRAEMALRDLLPELDDHIAESEINELGDRVEYCGTCDSDEWPCAFARASAAVKGSS